MYLFENITLFFVHFAGLGTFTRFPHSITLTATNGVEQTVRMRL